MNVIQLVGTAVFAGYDSGLKPNFILAGGRAQSQMFWIDGSSDQNMRLGIGQMDTDPPVEMVQEIQVLTNNYAAEFGGSNGGVIIETTKSGANEFHGSALEYLRNNKMDAQGSSPAIQTAPNSSRNCGTTSSVEPSPARSARTKPSSSVTTKAAAAAPATPRP